ncbi:MAG: hypothetical protein HKL80_05595 [Acidimicrobiales bacterium]|nr:hypothetical protein [Acidimicrobiales bacterium]
MAVSPVPWSVIAIKNNTFAICLLSFVASALAISAILGICIVGGTIQESSWSAVEETQLLSQEICVLSGNITGLNQEQSYNANAIVTASMSASGENIRAAQISVMAGILESSLSNQLSNLTVGIGIYKDFPANGNTTIAELMDPVYSTILFTQKLVAVPKWQVMFPWDAAQIVEPSLVGIVSNFDPYWKLSGLVVSAVLANGNKRGACGQGIGSVANSSTTHGLPKSYSTPSNISKDHLIAVNFALSELGKPYSWGSLGPNSFDAPGLVEAAWGAAGIEFKASVTQESQLGVSVKLSQLEPGDLVFTKGADSKSQPNDSHVGIYLGNNLVVSAINPHYGIAVQSWGEFVSGGVSALRDPAPGE